MRLDRVVSHATGLSRSQAQRAIRDGDVCVDGAVIVDGSIQIGTTACLEYRGQVIAAPQARYFMLNKPVGYICASRDSVHRTVMELLDVPTPAQLHIAGRLDIDATGLVLISDDGDWSHRVTSPRHEFPKVYRATLAGPLSNESASVLTGGVQLRGETHRCKPVELEVISGHDVRLTITEGKYHQVKRMFAAVGNHVLALHRERIGHVMLDPALSAGMFRPLEGREVSGF